MTLASLACLFALLAADPVHTPPDDLLQTAVRGLGDTLRRIQSLHVVMRKEMWEDDRLSFEHRGEWWQKGKTVRWKCHTTSHIHRHFDVEGRQLPTDHLPPRVTVGDELFFDGQPIVSRTCSYPVWSQAVLAVDDFPGTKLHEVFESKALRLSARSVEEAGKKLVLIEALSLASPPPMPPPLYPPVIPSFRVWLSPEHSFLPVKLLMSHHSGAFDEKKDHSVWEVIGFHPADERRPIPFPAEVVYRSRREGEERPHHPKWVSRVLFDTVEINGEIPADLLKFVPPPLNPYPSSGDTGASSGGWSRRGAWSLFMIANLLLLACVFLKWRARTR